VAIKNSPNNNVTLSWKNLSVFIGKVLTYIFIANLNNFIRKLKMKMKI